MRHPLDAFPVRFEAPVRWGEMDAYGHVNNTVYFRYFEDARIQYFEAVGLHEIKDATNIAAILGSTECRYRVPLTFPDKIVVGARTTELGSDRFTMEYSVYSEKHQKIAATGSGLLVAFDYANQRKADMPEALIRSIEALEGTNLSSPMK